MKKILSISFALLILISGLNFTVSTHFCGGKVAASKVSLYGELASCGMEESSTDQCKLPISQVHSNCCQTKVSSFVIDSNYTPSFTDFKFFGHTALTIFIVPESDIFHNLTSLSLASSDTSPPENSLVHAVSLPKICVFLI